MHLDNFFKRQNLYQDQDEFDENFPVVFIQFTIDDAHFAINIVNVKEIVENTSITPYPEERLGHLGIISLRGQIIPVVEIIKNQISDKAAKKRRFVILEFDKDFLLCIPVDKARRVELMAKDYAKKTFINIDDLPVKILAADDFMHIKNGTVL